MIQDGTKRKCAYGEHQVRFDAPQGWHHMSKDDWADHPHKAAPRKYVRRNKNAGEEVRVNQAPEGVRSTTP
jgi:hypothetical protein